MKLSVTTKKIKITTPSVINEGEVNVTECEFDFDAKFDGMVKKAVFTLMGEKRGTGVVCPILDNKCMVPSEVLKRGAFVLLGVYAYNLDDAGKLALRYSPAPVRFMVSPGSYRKCAKPSRDIAPVPQDVYDAEIQKQIERVDDLVKEVQYRIESGEFKGDKGAPGRSPYIGENGNWFSYDEFGSPVDTGIKASPDLSIYATKEEIPEKLPNPEALTLEYNDEKIVDYDGSEAKTGKFKVNGDTVATSEEDKTPLSEQISDIKSQLDGGMAVESFSDAEWAAMFN